MLVHVAVYEESLLKPLILPLAEGKFYISHCTYLHQNSHEKTSSHLVVRVKHEDFCGFCFYFAEVVQITETGTHCELNAAVLLKEGTPT